MAKISDWAYLDGYNNVPLPNQWKDNEKMIAAWEAGRNQKEQEDKAKGV